MIRDKNRIYAEANALNTVLTSEILEDSRIIKGTNLYHIQNGENSTGILATDENGNQQIIAANTRNKILATDENGNIIWIGG